MAQPPVNTVVLKDGIRYFNAISKRYVCPWCKIFCMELTPVFSRKMLRMARARGIDPTVKIYCRNDCHFKEDWGWEIFDWGSIHQRNQIREWPKADGQDFEKAMRRS